ncbi:hypothetical protein ACFQL4_01855 [Halosimplex aquaticum]
MVRQQDGLGGPPRRHGRQRGVRRRDRHLGGDTQCRRADEDNRQEERQRGGAGPRRAVRPPARGRRDADGPAGRPPASGHVSVRPVGTNETIGSQSLAAGSHENVTVELDESYVADQSRDFRVHVVAHRDDGDGSFGPEDPPITAGDRTVGTYLVVSPDAETDDGPVINTPTVTTAPGGSATPSASATASATASDPATTDPAGESTSSETDAATGTAADGPGFGVALAVLVVVLSLVAARSHRR